MPNVLPEIIDRPEPENTETDAEIIDNTDNEIIKKELEEEYEKETELVEVEAQKKVKIDHEQVFQKPVMKPVAKKKRVMSDEKKEQLAKARAKAYEGHKRRKELKEKQQQDEEEDLKELIEEKKTQKINKMVERAEKQQDAIIKREKVIVSNQNITIDDIEKITASAIGKYESDRQERKVIRKKKESEDNARKNINNTIRRAQGREKAPEPHEAGYFNQCFGD